MTLVKSNTCEGSNGVTVSTSNSAGPDQFNAVVVGTNATVAYDTAQAAFGSTAVKIATGVTSTSPHVAFTGFSSTRMYARVYARFATFPSIGGDLFQLVMFKDSFPNPKAAMGVKSDGHWTIFDSGGGIVATSGTTLSTNTWYRFDLDYNLVSGQTVLVQVYDMSNNQVGSDLTYTTTASMAGTCAQVWYGITGNGGANVPAFHLDNITASDAPLFVITPPAATFAATAAGTPIYRVILQNTCEGTDGATVTTSNSGGPDQFNAVTISSGTVAYDSAQFHGGSTSIRFQTASSSHSGYVQWTLDMQTWYRVTAQMYVRFADFPVASGNDILEFFNSSSTFIGGLRILGHGNPAHTGSVVIKNQAGTTIGTVDPPLANNTWYRFDIDFDFRNGGGMSLDVINVGTGLSVGSTSASATSSMAGPLKFLRLGVTINTLGNIVPATYVDDLLFSEYQILITPPVAALAATAPAPTVALTPVPPAATLAATAPAPTLGWKAIPTVAVFTLTAQPAEFVGLSLYLPADNETIPVTRPTFYVRTSVDFDASGVQIEIAVDDNSSFSSAETHVIDIDSTVGTVMTAYKWPTSLADDTYYWRARVYDGDSWSSWTPYRTFEVDVVTTTEEATGSWTVVTGTPDEHLWFTRPEAARVGDSVVIYGQGLGTTDADVFIAGEAATVTTWEAVAADADAYTSDRVIDAATGVVNPEHHRIVATVPDISAPGGQLYVVGS